jgi:hypothetical protein
VSITPTDIEIFPASYDHLAIGVTFTAKLPGRLFDAKGTVWLTARSAVEKGGRSVRLEDIKVTRQIDNPLWSVACSWMCQQRNRAMRSLAKAGGGGDRNVARHRVRSSSRPSDRTRSILASIASRSSAELGMLVTLPCEPD